MMDYRANVHTSDGPGCFWTVTYNVMPLVQTTGPDTDELHRRDVNVLADHQPTIAEAYTAIPADEQARVTSVSVKPMDPNRLGHVFATGSKFVDLHSGYIGPLLIQVTHETDIRAHLDAVRQREILVS